MWSECEPEGGSLTVAVEGCCHGELDKIYATISEGEEAAEQIIGVNEEEDGEYDSDRRNMKRRKRRKVDLLLICGDFECVRDVQDLECVAVPQKYRKLNTFHEYVSGKKVAPVMTIFIGGNHEASNVLQSLYYGGWVAPNIYFLGYAGVVWYGGLRIAGMSGIFDKKHYQLGHFEQPPYRPDTLRSVYHLRELEVFRLSMISGNVDCFLSHDWPCGIEYFGNRDSLLRKKPYFREESDQGTLGNPPAMALLKKLKPKLWFSAHLHVKFSAVVDHQSLKPTAGLEQSLVEEPLTRFLALDKVLPGRDFLQILNVPRRCPTRGIKVVNGVAHNCLEHDVEWLAILRETHGLLQETPYRVQMPIEVPTITEEDMEKIRSKIGIEGIYVAPYNSTAASSNFQGNWQTDRFLSMLELPHVWTRPSETGGAVVITHSESDPNELSISVDEEDESDIVDDTEACTQLMASEDPNEISLED